MAGAPDLFVVCKNCHAEVSPYITECPYCGHRLRKRAPKLDKGGVPKPPRGASRRKTRRPRLSPLRSGELAGRGGGSGRPHVALGIVLVSLVVSVLARTTLIDPLELIIGVPDDVWRRALTAPFFYASTGYALVAIGSTFLFAWLLGRRHGGAAALLVFAICAVGGMWAADALDPGAVAAGGNGGALGLLAAWSVRDLLVRRRSEEVEWDGLGVLVIALVLILLPAAVVEANPLAGAAGGLAGLVIGLVLARLPRR